MIYFAVVHEIPSTNYSVTLDTIAQGHWPESVRIPNVGESIVLDSNYYDILRIDFEIETEPAHLPGIEGELVGGDHHGRAIKQGGAWQTEASPSRTNS